jgi:hypothetical protein
MPPAWVYYLKQIITRQHLKLKNDNSLVPCVRFTSVLPICRVLNIDGAFTSYQSFLVNGSILKARLNVINILWYTGVLELLLHTQFQQQSQKDLAKSLIIKIITELNNNNYKFNYLTNLLMCDHNQ